MIPSGLINFFSRLSESAVLYPRLMILMLLLFLFLCISAAFILLKLRRADKVLIAVERELDAFERNSGQPSSGEKLTQNLPNIGKPDLNRVNLKENPKLDHVNQNAGMVSLDPKGLKRHVLRKMKDYLSTKKKTPTTSSKTEDFVSSLKTNPDLKKTILDRISETDKLMSLQHLAKHLSLKRFAGNYHPILNELDRLEREGEIECQVINGKVFFKKKQKTKQKFILRKGRNFRKYIG